MKPIDKLSQSIDRGDFVFQRPPRPGEEKTFEEIFPTMQDINILVEETGDDRDDLPRPHPERFQSTSSLTSLTAATHAASREAYSSA